jgi:cytochrome c-type biogenesis protein CcmH
MNRVLAASLHACVLACTLLAALLVCTSAGAIDARTPFADAQQQARYERLVREIRCLVCQNEPIADSNAPLAADLRREVRERIEAGESDREILAFLTARYGDFVLYRPPFTPRTWLLWLAPGLLLLVGGGIFVRVLRTRADKPIDQDWVDPAEDSSR